MNRPLLQRLVIILSTLTVWPVALPLPVAATLPEAISAHVAATRYEETTGFVRTLFVASDLDAPPFLATGSPGCQRVAFIFNVGVGFEPDPGILDTL